MSAPERSVADLTNWFLNAKRSLNSVTYCTRGNEIITTTRNALMDASIMAARAAFIKSGIKDELKLLRHAKNLMDTQQAAAEKEFDISLQHLDEADRRLKQMLDSLRATEVESAFTMTEAGEQQQKTLHDFVDEDGIENLRNQVKVVIDQIKDTNESFESHLGPFSELIKSVTHSLETLIKSPLPHPVPAITPSLQSMEEHAAVMASLLESLARHYDLCSHALKRAESNDPGSSQDGEPETEQDRANMLAVLERDAGEVDDVVAEIQERLSEMEATSLAIDKTLSDTVEHYQQVMSLLGKMHECQTRLVECTVQSKDFVVRQKDNQDAIAEKLEGLQALTDHYVLFGEAYDGLLVEVGRRIMIQREKEAIIREAMTKIDRINEHDLNEREQFRSEFGDYLPSDIWPGLSDPPGTYTVQPSAVWEVPDVKQEIIELAMTRRAAAVSSAARQF